MDAQMLAKLQQHLRVAMPNIRSVVIIRHGRLVFEHYRQGLSRDDLHEVHSITKSVTSALVGIAVEQRYFASIDQKLVDYVPEFDDSTEDPHIKEITLRHVLTMTSGFEWDFQAVDACARLQLSACSPKFWRLMINDWIGFALQRPIVHSPGQVFNYDSPSVHLLSVALSRATQMSAAKFAEQQLFGPLGIARYRWPTDAQGYSYGAFGLELTARDMAKLGQLYLNRGLWEGKQLIPADFVDASTRKQNAGGLPAQANYGYLWWVSPDTDNVSAYFANGRGGQYVIVVPSMDLVVAIASSQDHGSGIVKEFILPAVLK